MRSFLLRAALAAVLASTSFGAAYAARGDHDHDHGGPSSHRDHDFQPPDEADNSYYFDHMTMGPPGVPSASPPVAAAPMTGPIHGYPAYRPRLDRVVSELGTANRRIRADHNRGLLSRAETRTLEARAHDIRMDAVKIAEHHRGFLPEASYAALQYRVARLDHAIQRDATT